MFLFGSDAPLIDDREDLIALLRMRFGSLPVGMIEDIYEINDMNSLQRLILTAANAADWSVFLEEFHSGRDSYRLIGENFNPLRDLLKGSDEFNGKAQE